MQLWAKTCEQWLMAAECDGAGNIACNYTVNFIGVMIVNRLFSKHVYRPLEGHSSVETEDNVDQRLKHLVKVICIFSACCLTAKRTDKQVYSNKSSRLCVKDVDTWNQSPCFLLGGESSGCEGNSTQSRHSWEVSTIFTYLLVHYTKRISAMTASLHIPIPNMSALR